MKQLMSLILCLMLVFGAGILCAAEDEIVEAGVVSAFTADEPLIEPEDAPPTSDAVFLTVALLAVSATAAIIITKKH